MSSEGHIFVKEDIKDKISSELKDEEKLDPYESDEDWNTNIERQFPKDSKIPIIRYREEDGVETKEITGYVNVELESVVKRNNFGEEYVGREIKIVEVDREDNLPKKIY